MKHTINERRTMMKKLLVLSLVLAIAGLANATWSIAYENGSIAIYNDEGVVGGISNGLGVQIVGSDVRTTLVTDQVVWRSVDMPDGTRAVYIYTGEDTAPGSTTENAWPEMERFNGGIALFIWSNEQPNTVGIPSPAGFWVSMPVPFASGLSLTDDPNHPNLKYVIELTDGNGDNLQSLFFVPEPMTIGLLGLGALFLRKRA